MAATIIFRGLGWGGVYPSLFLIRLGSSGFGGFCLVHGQRGKHWHRNGAATTGRGIWRAHGRVSGPVLLGWVGVSWVVDGLHALILHGCSVDRIQSAKQHWKMMMRNSDIFQVACDLDMRASSTAQLPGMFARSPPASHCSSPISTKLATQTVNQSSIPTNSFQHSLLITNIHETCNPNSQSIIHPVTSFQHIYPTTTTFFQSHAPRLETR